MLGKRSLQIINTLIRISAFLRLTTFKWYPQKYILIAEKPTTSIFTLFTVTRLGFKLVNLLTVVTLSFGSVRILQGVYVFNMSFQDTMFQVFILSIYALACIVSFCNILRMDEVGKFYSLFIQYEKKLTG